ncbi:hypothetical protein BKA62DRAFT_780407 [Auriculariales sp. MPI-PUGE-AT-0066]|nr:hypothetical protein BKA62DRAFT_780407 [Auriculariales sp. MPI-PUGE-AT-0066]
MGLSTRPMTNLLPDTIAFKDKGTVLLVHVVLAMIALLRIIPAAGAYTPAIASDVGCLQTKGGVLCYYPNPTVAKYVGNTCTNALLSGALHNHIELHDVNPGVTSTAHYDSQLNFVGDATWNIPRNGTRFIRCHQGALPLHGANGVASFHSWCYFVPTDPKDHGFNFATARDGAGICSRVHAGGFRAERDGCVVHPQSSGYGWLGWPPARPLV